MEYKNNHRLPEEFYQQGLFFITICTNYRLQLLSYLDTEQELILTEFGEVVFNALMKIPRKYEHVMLPSWVLMPDHIHFIIDINISTKHNHLFKILQWLKSKTAIDYDYGVRHFGWSQITKTVWQPDFYDKIVWSGKSRESIEYYIKNNPSVLI